MVRVVLIVILVALTAGCQTNNATSSRTEGRSRVEFSGGDGSTLGAAIVITGAGALGAVDAERMWLNEHAPSARKDRQALLSEGERFFDQITVTLPDGSSRDYFFDITDSMKAMGKLFGI